MPALPPSAMSIHSPFRVESWSSFLANHPNKLWVDSLISGLKEGVRIGFTAKGNCRPAKSNLLSADSHPEGVKGYLEAEAAAGRVAGPFSLDELPSEVMFNRIGVIPKANKPGKWRLIVDLSFPQGASVNDGISIPDSSMVYSSIDDAARMIASVGRGAWLAKIDISNAYRNIPVHPDDRGFLGMRWGDQAYIDNQLPFGLRSAPILFNAYADALEWILRDQGVSKILHYLDDFLVIGAPDSGECQEYLDKMLAVCAALGVPLATEKVEGPSSSLSFLGIHLDTVALEASLPLEKMVRLREELDEWHLKKSCTRKELEHLIGVLQFACKVVAHGRPFVRRMINLLSVTSVAFHHIRLNREFRSDLAWWKTYVEKWNGVSFLQLSKQLIPSVNVFTDASGGFGCGAIWGTVWLQGQWPCQWQSVNIMIKELVPVVLACAMWGAQWAGHHVLFHIDNMAVVDTLRKGSCKEPSGLAMHLMRALSFISAHYQFSVAASHIAGVYNTVADDISRDRLSNLPLQVPGIHPQPTPIPSPL